MLTFTEFWIKYKPCAFCAEGEKETIDRKKWLTFPEDGSVKAYMKWLKENGVEI